MSDHDIGELADIDELAAERILDAAARGEVIEGFERLGELLTAFHEPASAAEATAALPAAAVTPAARARPIGRLTRRTAVASAAGMFALSGVAAAVTGGAALFEPIMGSEEPGPSYDADASDTLFNYGYDEGLHLFVWNTRAIDGQHDCTLENGPVEATYTIEDGSIVVDRLTSDIDGQEMDVSFPDRNDATAEPLPYAVDGACALAAAEVAGPNGQINHGMFMKLFNSLYEGTGRGCLNRYLAQSDLGKSEQQIRTSEVDPILEPVADGDTGEIEFSSFTADCEHGNANGHGNANATGNGNGHGNANGHGYANATGNGNGNGHQIDDGTETRVAETGSPESPGRSAEAPGHKK